MSDKKRKPSTSTTIYVRVPNTLLAEIDAHHTKLDKGAETGAIVSRAGAIHNLIRAGLAASARRKK